MNSIRLFARGFATGFKTFGHSINGVVNFFLLSLVYLLGVGPTSIIGRLLGKRFLDLKADSGETYWVDNKVSKEDIENYHRMF